MKLAKVLLAAAAVLTPAAFAQMTLGNISGTVTDAQGAMIAGAKVEVKNLGTNLVIPVKTNNSGLYQATNLQPGTYSVTIQNEGFEKSVFTEILVSANRTTTVDAQLKVGQLSSTVEVTGTPLRNENDVAVGYVLDSATIQSTPLGTGSFTQLAILSPGVNADFLSGSGTNAGLGNQNIWSNGMRDTSNNFTINAISANNLFNGKSSSQVSESRFLLNTGQNSITKAGGGETQTSTSVYNAIGQGLPTPPPETVEEIRVNTAQYDASQGGNSGAQIAVMTKGGTNGLHGQLYEYFQNNAFNAAPFFRNSDSTISAHDKVPALHYNRYGATLGGPIKKDKAFFFISYQGIQNFDALFGNSYATVPQHLTDDRSAAALSAVALADFGQTIAPSAIDPAAAKLLNFKIGGKYLIPSVTVTDPAAAGRLGYNALINGTSPSFTQNQANGNVDWNFSAADRFSAKYFVSDNPSSNPFAQSTVIGFPQTLAAGSQVVSLNNTYVVRPTLTWEQRVGFTRQRAFASMGQALTPADVGINLFGSTRFPTLEIFQADGTLRNALFVGPKNNFGNAGVFQNRFAYATNANYVWGRHTLYFGLDANHTQLNIINKNNETAQVEPQTFADFLRGSPLNTSFSFYFTGASNRYYRADTVGAFVQDNYKMRPNLTISAGLRYDFNGPFSEKYGRLTNFHADAYQYDAAADKIINSGLVIAGNNPTLGTKGVSDSTLTGKQWGIGPRIGIAWSPGFAKNLTIRAGAGIYFDRGELFTYLSPGAGRGFSGPFGVTLQLPFTAQVAATSTGTLDNPFGTAPVPAPTTAAALNTLLPNLAQLKTGASPYLFGGYDSRNVLPYTENWSLDLQYQLKNSWLFTLGYVGNHSIHQILPIPFNQPGIATPSNPIRGEQYSYGFNMISTETLKTSDGGNTGIRTPFLGFSTNNVLYQTIGVANYNSLQAGLRKRLTHGLQMTASYTWSHTIDEQSGLGLFYNGNDPYNPKSSYATSSYDRTHVFITAYLYELPSPAKSRMLGTFVNGWQLNGLVTAQSGQPFNFYDFSGAVAGQYYANTVSILDPIIGFQPGLKNSQVQLQSTHGVDPGKPYIDVSKLYIPVTQPGTGGTPPCVTAGATTTCDTVEAGFANSGRNVFRGPFQARADLSVVKNFKINERFKLRYSAEFYNITNHPSFDAPNNSTSLFSVSSGKVTVRTPSSTAGFITHTLGSPRFVQMTLRLMF